MSYLSFLKYICSSHKYRPNFVDYLETVAIRPPLTYGEGDEKFVPRIFEYLSSRGFSYPRIAGAGGKQQLVYAGKLNTVIYNKNLCLLSCFS